MSTEATRFTVSVHDAYGSLNIQGMRVGQPDGDGFYVFSIQVEAEGLVIKTKKTMDPKSIYSFVQKLKSIGAATTTQTVVLRSWGGADFDLSVESQQGVCHMSFKLIHGASSQWTVHFALDLLVSNIQADASV